jgi:hypothetical protein
MTTEPPKVRPMAWDPKSPATLLLPKATADVATVMDGSNSNNKDTAFCLDKFVSHDGVGCNTYETSAVMNLLDAHDAYVSSKTHSWTAHKSLSKAYRKALNDCLQGWEEGLKKQTGDDNDNDEADEADAPKDTASTENIELLKLVYAVTQLSETFLLLKPNDAALDYYETTAHLPGAVTADTVRYLRFHHIPDAYAVVADVAMVDEVLDSLHPDQVGEDGAVYWKLIEKLVIRGCLEDAWSLLSRHSICRRCFDESLEALDDYHATTLAEDREGFVALKSLVLSAPLPGGRGDEHDAGFDILAEEEEVGDEELLEGVPPSAYRLWETGQSSREAGDYPITFNSHGASQMHRKWMQCVKQLPEVNKLKRRIPQLDNILNILSGNFKHVEFDSWDEALCAELLYKLPSLRPDDMTVRAEKVMQQFDAFTKGGFEEVVLSVMKGNAGRVIQVMHELGGGSGAALPALMVCLFFVLGNYGIDTNSLSLLTLFFLFRQTSLLCNLLTDSQAMPIPEAEDSLQTELLLNASFAIRSSLAAEGLCDLGTRLSVRLLLPYVQLGGDEQITATVGETLEHHTPQSDAEARTLLSLCRGLVERKNVRVLDGCVSITLSRYRHYMEDQRPGGAVHWLLTGMELESLVLCDNSDSGLWQRELESGVCYRILVTSCMETTRSLLIGLLGEEEGVSLVYARAQEMVSAHKESKIASFVPAVKVLSHVVAMAEAIVERKDQSLVASNIVACLEEKANDEDDAVVSSLARSSLHWDLLRLAHLTLDRHMERDGLDNKQVCSASFDVRGMQVLLERFTVIAASRDVERLKPLSAEETSKMRLALGNGLMRAFVAENAKKKRVMPTKAGAASVAGICAADLGKYSRDKQEKVVELMLDF